MALTSNPAPIVACTVARNVQSFDLLIDDIEAELGEAWGDLQFMEAQTFLTQPEAQELEFIAVAVDAEDERNTELLVRIIELAKGQSIKVMLVAENVSPPVLHRLLQAGTDDFVPYPLPEGAFHESLERIRSGREIAEPSPLPEDANQIATTAPAPTTTSRKDRVVFAVQSLAGGTGATTLATNLAWELATVHKKKAPSVCLIDLDLQFGSVATFLDLPRRDAIFELLSDAETMDQDAFRQALLTYNDKLSVFTAPADILPLDLITSEQVEALLSLAKESFDIIIVDMPTAMVQWTETVLSLADIYFATLELDMRSAQNTMRFVKVLQSESLPLEKVNFVLNRAPGGFDLSGKSRVKRLAESLGIELKTQLPDGAKQVVQAGDHGSTLAEMARKNPLRKEIAKLAKSLHGVIAADATAD